MKIEKVEKVDLVVATDETEAVAETGNETGVQPCVEDTEVAEKGGEEQEPCGKLYIEVWETKKIKVTFEGRVLGRHIPRVKRALTLGYVTRKRELRNV